MRSLCFAARSQNRFQIPIIAELYGSTEGCGNAFTLNTFDKPGAVGFHGPLYRATMQATRPRIFKIDVATETLIRDPKTGLLIECAAGESGEFLGKIIEIPGKSGGSWDGYFGNSKATNDKIIGDVLEKGDKWIRTGDLLVRDWRGYIWFVDRIGDTWVVLASERPRGSFFLRNTADDVVCWPICSYRWKGENVSTMEVRDMLMDSGIVEEANVYGVQVPNNLNGRAGMAAAVLKTDAVKRYGSLEETMKALGKDLQKKLPHYAVPRFIRLKESMDSAQTVTFKHRKVELQNEGFDPEKISEPLWFFVENSGYVPLTPKVYAGIVGGKARL